jgi:hypothetical protein
MFHRIIINNAQQDKRPIPHIHAISTLWNPCPINSVQ